MATVHFSKSNHMSLKSNMLLLKVCWLFLAKTSSSTNIEIVPPPTHTHARTQFSNGSSFLIAMDSNSRSTGWYDSQTNSRGKIPEEYLTCRDLYVMNDESELTTFQSHRGSSNTDLTIVNNRLLKNL